MNPSDQSELIKEAARIDPLTGRLPENQNDPMCDHCDERRWTVLLTFSGEFMRSRKLCTDCTVEVLEWV